MPGVCAALIMGASASISQKAKAVVGTYFVKAESGKEDKHGQIPPHGACTLFETNSLKKVGGYSENVNAQDGWDLWYKLYKKVGAISIDLPLFYYRQHNASLSQDNNRLLKARAKIFEEFRWNDQTFFS